MPTRKDDFMSNEPKWGCDFIGPFETKHYDVSVDGYKVPLVVAHRGEDHNDGKVRIIMDNRFIFEFEDNDQLKQALVMLAHGMAIAAGYSCFGEHSVKEPNPFKYKINGP